MHLAIFAKYWTPGEAKTRLAKTLGPRAASRLARAFLKTTISRLATVNATRYLVVSPDSSRRAFEHIARGRFQVALQRTGALGERLQHWFESRFTAGATRVVVLGADSPDVPLEYVKRAFAELQHYQAVIGPARDGGYYLLGLRDRMLPLFEGIDWGTPAVFQQTLDRLRTSLADYSVLPEWYDVDTVNDLSLLCRNLATAKDDESCRGLLCTIRRVTSGWH
ncbi:MAG: TIGR04282 family arsenosugar biosynthesis glycosyltransferase [Pirellulales bacterium]